MQKEVIRNTIFDLFSTVLEEEGSNIEVTEQTIIYKPMTSDAFEFQKSELLSSLQIVTLIVSIENRFQIEISDEEMGSFSTLNDLVEIVNNKINTSSTEI